MVNQKRYQSDEISESVNDIADAYAKLGFGKSKEIPIENQISK